MSPLSVFDFPFHIFHDSSYYSYLIHIDNFIFLLHNKCFNTINGQPAQQAIINDNGGMHNILDLTPQNDGICSFIRVVIVSIYVVSFIML